jgi:hypothetical protein
MGRRLTNDRQDRPFRKQRPNASARRKPDIGIGPVRRRGVKQIALREGSSLMRRAEIATIQRRGMRATYAR